MDVFDLPVVARIVDLALEEDLGRGDVTTSWCIPESVEAVARVTAKEDGILAGGPLVLGVYERLGGKPVDVRSLLAEGSLLAAGAVLGEFVGRAADLLAGERVALNFLQRMCGVATLTGRFVEAVRGTKARVVDTRKTQPGLRVLDKYAVRMGGGVNHRFGLDDGVLIKDNHIVAAGGLRAAVERVRSRAPHTLRVEVECAVLEQVDEALAAGVDAVLLDNMSPEELVRAVRRVDGRVLTEASGGVTLETVREVAFTGVDLVSVGALTHSAPALDIGMDLVLQV